MFILGVTGGIGTGKSSVSNILKEMGAQVIDADQISKQTVDPFKPAWIKIKDFFGGEIIKTDQTIDREILAKVVFESADKRLMLEEIVHAEVVSEMKAMLENFRKSAFDGVVVMDVPIPVRHGFLDIVDEVWVVVCDYEIRINRITERSGISREDAEKRISAQLTQEEYIKLSDEVINNSGTFTELRKTVIKLYQKLINGMVKP